MARKKIGDVELQWTCPNCNGLNPGSASFCQSCGAAQPTDVEFHLPERQELLTDEAKIERAAAGPDIHCPYCGTRNPAGSPECSQCGGDLTTGEVRKSGQVLGAFESRPAGTVICRNCGSENPDQALKCAHCGASLAPEPEVKAPVAPPAAAPASRGASPLLIAGLVLVAVVICGALVFMLLRGAQTENLQATVNQVQWELAIPVEALVVVERTDWRDQVPASADINQCEPQVREVRDNPAPNAVEVCGTPYTVDSGGGFAEVVQDCVYEVYDDYCSYAIQEWQQVDLAVARGQDFSPRWPAPSLQSGERLGDTRQETYIVVFDTGAETYSYQPQNFEDFTDFQPGSTWTLVVNGFGDVVSVEQ
jgi:ribosomal protein L40E